MSKRRYRKERPGACIIEAMKLMNEIESETAGKIVQILVEAVSRWNTASRCS
jgi:hypothetical protein